MANNREGITDFGFGFVIGGIIGAGTALLLAPAKGEDTRQMIGDKFGDVVRESKQEIDTVREVVRQEISKLGKKKDALHDAFSKGVDTFKTHGDETVEE